VIPPSCLVDTDCADGDLCTTDKCQAGTCVNPPVVCSVGQACAPATGLCVDVAVPDAPLAIVFDGDGDLSSWKVYVACWGDGVSGNFVGWGPYDTTTCGGVGETCGIEASEGNLTFGWQNAGDSVWGCDANLQNPSTGKWAPGCDNASCSTVFGADITAKIWYGGLSYTMLVIPNGSGGLKFHWTAP